MTYRNQIMTMFNATLVGLTKRPVESYMSKTQEEGVYILWINAHIAAGFTLVCMPGCCGIVISTNCYVVQHYQCKGLGTLLNTMRKQIAWEMGYTVLMCTDVVDNAPQQRILSKNGWQSVFGFINRRSGNTVHADTFELEDTGIALGF